MQLSNIGDLAQSTLLRRDTARVKNDLDRLTGEMTSGMVADLNTALRGQFGPLAGLGRSLSLSEAHVAANGAAARFAEGQQIALQAVHGSVQAAGPAFLEAAGPGSDVQRSVLAGQASQQFRQALSALNTQIEGKALFGGAALDRPAVSDADAILAGLETALLGVVGPADALDVVADWFDAPGGGFETVAYQGSAVPMSDMVIGQGEAVGFGVTAADSAVRDSLRGLALGALLDRGLFAGDPSSRRAIMQGAGEALITAADGLTVRRAEIGFAEARIETARVRTDAEMDALRLARAALVEADPYETALRLQEVRVQLETIYAVTARVSYMSLAQVLR